MIDKRNMSWRRSRVKQPLKLGMRAKISQSGFRTSQLIGQIALNGPAMRSLQDRLILEAYSSKFVIFCVMPNLKIQKSGAEEVWNAQVCLPASDLER
jgi:hypothetical protein